MRLQWLFGVVLGCGGSDDLPSGDDNSSPETGDTGEPEVAVDLAPVLGPALGSGVPALGAAVFDRDGVLALGVAGVRAADGDVAVRTPDRWHLGSDTKAMTATLVATFVDEGVVDWETPVPELFPQLVVDPAWDEVTLAHLLQHRSGMGDPGEHLDWWDAMWNADDPVAQRAEFAADVFAAPPDYPVGVYRYSNFGYIAIGAALEHLAGEAWEDLLRARLLDPLGMASCGFGPPGTPGEVDQPWGHTGTAGSYVPIDPGDLYADNPPTLGPAGSVHCTLADWGTFGSEHLRGPRGESAIVSAAAFTWMHTPPPGETYAAGWGAGADPAFGGAFVTHDGSNTMWFASIVVAFDADRVYLVTANAGDPIAVDAVYDVLLALPGR